MKPSWHRVRRRAIFNARNADEISVVGDTIDLSEGRQFEYVYVHSPYEVVFVVGITGDDEIVLLNQYRYVVDSVVVEVPAGSPESGESLEDAARREFEEESGYAAGQLHKLGSFYPSVGITDQINHVFVAWDLTPSQQRLDVTEAIEAMLVPLNTAVDMVHEGQILNLASAHGILLVAEWRATRRRGLRS